jgi:hypothetical protein
LISFQALFAGLTAKHRYPLFHVTALLVLARRIDSLDPHKLYRSNILEKFHL